MGHTPAKTRLPILAGTACLLLLCLSASVSADERALTLTIQPVLSEQKTRRVFTPLAQYLSHAIGRTVTIRTQPNFLAHWEAMRRPDSSDLILDAAHFTDYRATKLGYVVLVKLPDFVSHSVVVRRDDVGMVPTELVAKPIATLGAPSLGAVRLSAMFPNPMRQPTILEVANADEGIRKLLSGKVFAVILPTPIVSDVMRHNDGLGVVTTTEPIPHTALSAAPRVDAETRNKIRQALIHADQTEAGRKMLKQIGFPRFDPADESDYRGQAKVLEKYWGY